MASRALHVAPGRLDRPWRAGEPSASVNMRPSSAIDTGEYGVGDGRFATGDGGCMAPAEPEHPSRQPSKSVVSDVPDAESAQARFCLRVSAPHLGQI